MAIPPPTSSFGESRESKSDLENLNENLNNNENIENEVEVPEIRRSQRNIKQPSRFDDNYVYNGCIYVNYCSTDSPVSFKEAIESDESSFWVDAMNKEMNSLEKNKIWELVEKPNNEKVIDLKWTYTKKSENVYKARIVVRGCQQKDMLDDIYSPESIVWFARAAEYVALSEAVSEILLIKDLLINFNVEFKKPVNVYEDNSGAVIIAKYGNFTIRSKYIEVHYHFVNENYEKGLIEIVNQFRK